VQGSGSGIDVAASAYGGTLRFEAGCVAPIATVSPSIVFSGRSARTGPRVARYLAWGPRDAFVASSRALVDGFEAHPVAAMVEGGRLLRAMAEQAGIAYWTDEIDALVMLAAAHGGGAKPSGAGGGDIVVALFPEPPARAAYEREARARGFVVIA
jgi:mevalonate kinase